MTEISALVPAFKRAVAPLGAYDSLYPGSTDAEVLGLLLDALGMCHMDGLVRDLTADPAGTAVRPVTPGEGALLILYASVAFLRAKVMNQKTRTKYEAQGTSAEQESGASVLVELLRDASRRVAEVRAAAAAGGEALALTVVDTYRLRDTNAYGPRWGL